MKVVHLYLDDVAAAKIQAKIDEFKKGKGPELFSDIKSWLEYELNTQTDGVLEMLLGDW